MDHKSILCQLMQTECIARWQQMLEEHGPQLAHIKGEENAVADGMSRLHHECACALACLDSDFSLEQNHIARECDKELETNAPINHHVGACCSGHAKDLEAETEFPMLPSLIEKEQKVDKSLMQTLKMTKQNAERLNLRVTKSQL